MSRPCVLSKELRTIYVTGELTEVTVASFRRAMAKLNRHKGKITVEICSEGGDVDAGFAMVDTIRTSRNPVKTVASCQVMSAAVIVLAAGHERVSLQNTNIMVHQGSFKIVGTYSEIVRGDMPMIKRAEKEYSVMLEKFTGKAASFWDKMWSNHQVYLTAQEAKSLNLIDKVLEW